MQSLNHFGLSCTLIIQSYSPVNPNICKKFQDLWIMFLNPIWDKSLSWWGPSGKEFNGLLPAPDGP
jgi:hypothetical protein